MKKENVYITLLTPHDCLEAYRILTEAGETITDVSAKGLLNDEYSHIWKWLHFATDEDPLYGNYWCRSATDDLGKTQISLPELEAMLKGDKPAKEQNEILCPTRGHLRKTFTSGEDGTSGFMPPVNEAVEFAEWIADNNIKRHPKTKLWYFQDLSSLYMPNYYTGTEIYNKFKNRK